MKKQNLFLLATALILMVVPLVYLSGAEFGGADDQAMKAIEELRPGYQPWANSLWEPASETASFLFAVQAAIGAGFIGYFFGYLRGKKAGLSAQQDEKRT